MHRMGIRIELIRNKKGIIIGTHFRSFLGHAIRVNVPIALNFDWRKVKIQHKQKLWEYLKVYYVLFDSDYKRVMRHAGSLMKTWRGRIKGKWYTKRLGTDDLWKVPEDKIANISKDDWHKYVKYCASVEGIKLSQDNRERGLKNECRALVGIKGMSDYEYNLFVEYN
ncbi:hypothetical protein ACFE04_006959 [Oxalis oulophora]